MSVPKEKKLQTASLILVDIFCFKDRGVPFCWSLLGMLRTTVRVGFFYYNVMKNSTLVSSQATRRRYLLLRLAEAPLYQRDCPHDPLVLLRCLEAYAWFPRKRRKKERCRFIRRRRLYIQEISAEQGTCRHCGVVCWR